MSQKFIFSLLFIFTATTLCQAQIKKGTVLLGGQVSAFSNNNLKFNNTPNNENKSSSASLNISIGKAYKDNKVVGIALTGSFNRSKQNINSSNFNTLNNSFYGVNIFYRQYKKLTPNFYFFGEAGIATNKGYQRQVQDINNTVSSANSIGVYAYITPGLSYKLYKKLQLELSLPNVIGLQYNYTKYKDNFSSNRYTNNQFGLSTAISSSLLNNLSIGFRLFL